MTDLWDYKTVFGLIFRFASLFLFWGSTQPEVLILMAIASPPEGLNRGEIWSTNKIDVTAAINTWGLENETRGFMEVTKADAGGFTAACTVNGAGRCTHTHTQKKHQAWLLIHSLTFTTVPQMRWMCGTDFNVSQWHPGTRDVKKIMDQLFD